MPREVTVSFWPWFYHRRMIPKWVAFALVSALALWWFTPHVVWLAPLGFFLFFPIEYSVHRFIYHHLAGAPGTKLLWSQHIAHHDAPQDLDYLFNAPPFGIAAAILLFGIYYGVATLAGAANSLGIAASITAGNYFGFVYYEWVHLTAHRPGITPVTPWNRALKRYHLWHHFKNEHYWFGVTTSTFDHLGGTWRAQDEVEASPTVRTLVPPEEHAVWIQGVREKKAKKERKRADPAPTRP